MAGKSIVGITGDRQRPNTVSSKEPIHAQTRSRHGAIGFVLHCRSWGSAAVDELRSTSSHAQVRPQAAHMEHPVLAPSRSTAPYSRPVAPAAPFVKRPDHGRVKPRVPSDPALRCAPESASPAFRASRGSGARSGIPPRRVFLPLRPAQSELALRRRCGRSVSSEAERRESALGLQPLDHL